MLVIEALTPDGLHVDFVRQLTGICFTEWQDLQTKITDFRPNPSSLDTLHWRWAKLANFQCTHITIGWNMETWSIMALTPFWGQKFP